MSGRVLILFTAVHGFPIARPADSVCKAMCSDSILWYLSGLPRPLEMDVCALKPQAKGAGVELQLGGGFWQRRVPDPLTPASAEHFHQGHMRKLQLQLLPPSERSAEGNGCENE
ncbi:hypothetical protein JZ751_014422, partial [Albula glossodonta]